MCAWIKLKQVTLLAVISQVSDGRASSREGFTAGHELSAIGLSESRVALFYVGGTPEECLCITFALTLTLAMPFK